MSLCFFPQAGKQGFKHVLESPTPSNSIKHTCTVFLLSRIEILGCLEMDRERGERGGGGGVDFHAILSIIFWLK